MPADPWSPRDWALQQAVDMLDASLCPGCGKPTWISHDKTSQWTPHKVKCESCESISILQAKQNPDEPHPSALHFYTEHVGYVAPKAKRRPTKP